MVDDELNINPPTPRQVGKRPPAPKPKREPAGHQGVAGGGYRPAPWCRTIRDVKAVPSGVVGRTTINHHGFAVLWE